MDIYVVKPGDTVDSIAAVSRVPVDSILYNNQLVYPYALAVGQALLLSTGVNEQERRNVRAGGYAYPRISQTVLEQTLPYLTDLMVFSYGFTPNGDLLPPPKDDTFMITLAREYNTAPLLTLTPLDAEGSFNNYLVTSVVQNRAAADNLISQLAAEIRNRGFKGVNIDFEYILASDREAYAAFVARVREAVNALGYPVSVALAPKTSDNMPGLLYEGMDYALLGEAADRVMLMTYEWGYTYLHLSGQKASACPRPQAAGIPSVPALRRPASLPSRPQAVILLSVSALRRPASLPSRPQAVILLSVSALRRPASLPSAAVTA